MDGTPSRQRETARQRALRIPLDYHRTGGRVVQWKSVLSLLLAVMGGVYVAWIVVGPATAVRQVSHGPLARVHSAWESDCRACHQAFAPLRADADGARFTALGLS